MMPARNNAPIDTVSRPPQTIIRIEGGMITLRQSGLQKVKEGVTTIEEVARVYGFERISAHPPRAAATMVA